MRAALTLALAIALTGALLAASPALAQPERAPQRSGELRMNHVQARGTHNSYHRDPMFPGRERSEIGWDYSHRPLAHQFEHQGVRQVELDIHYNWVRDDFEVYHVGIDARSTCTYLRECLAEIREWSDEHPDHQPIMILIEPKDGGPPKEVGLPEDGDPFTRPFTEDEYVELDRQLLEAFDGPTSAGGRAVTPDDVFVSGPTLRDSILAHGWPRLDDVRQRVVYVIDGDDHGAAYSREWTSLTGRAAFVQSNETDPVAAFVRRGGEERVRGLVAEGFMVRTLSGPSGFESAKRSGAQFISTDFPDDLHLSDQLDAPSRCNPVNAPAACRDHRIERHRHAGGDDYQPPPDTTSDDVDHVAADLVDYLVVRKVGDLLSLIDRTFG